METISKLVTLPGVTVVGKIVLPAKKNASRNVGKKRSFKLFNGGSTLGEQFKKQGIKFA